MRSQWQSFLDELAPYPSGMVKGKAVYFIAESVKNNIKNQGLFEPGDQPINLEVLVYPGENLAIGGDAQQLQTARNSMEEMNSWGVTRGGNTNNGFCKIFPIAVRVGWPADDLVAKFKKQLFFINGVPATSQYFKEVAASRRPARSKRWTRCCYSTRME